MSFWHQFWLIKGRIFPCGRHYPEWCFCEGREEKSKVRFNRHESTYSCKSRYNCVITAEVGVNFIRLKKNQATDTGVAGEATAQHLRLSDGEMEALIELWGEVRGEHHKTASEVASDPPRKLCLHTTKENEGWACCYQIGHSGDHLYGESAEANRCGSSDHHAWRSNDLENIWECEYCGALLIKRSIHMEK